MGCDLLLGERCPQKRLVLREADLVDVDLLSKFVLDRLFGTVLFLGVNDPSQKCYSLGLTGFFN